MTKLLWRAMNLLFIGALAGVSASSSPSSFAVTIVNGPHAGTYNLAHRGSLCFHSKSRRVYSAVWEGSEVHEPSAIGQAGVEVLNPDLPGPKVGSARISFGDTAQKPTVYEVTAKAVTITVSGRDAEIKFDGRTDAGVGIRIAVSCRDTDEM